MCDISLFQVEIAKLNAMAELLVTKLYICGCRLCALCKKMYRKTIILILAMHFCLKKINIYILI